MSIQQNFPAITPSLSLNFARSKTLDPRITFTRTSSATRVNEQGLIEVVPADAPRFDRRYENGVVRSLGLLVEESRSNVRSNSEVITSVNYSVGSFTNLTQLTTTTPINGLTTATKFFFSVGANVGNNQEGFNFGSGISLSNSTVYTQSIFVKASGSSVFRLRSNVTGQVFDIPIAGPAPAPTGTITACSVTPYPDGWSRITWTFTTTTSVPGNRADHWAIKTDIADGSSGFLITGAQLEAGSFATSYIPTGASTATRNPDNVSITGQTFLNLYNQNEGSYKVEGIINSILPANNFGGIFGAGGGSSTSNFIFLNPSNSFGQYVSNTGQSPASFLGKTYTSGVKYKIAGTYATNDFACSLNGDISTSTTNNALYKSHTYFRIGGNPISGITGGVLGTMVISNISFYSRRLTNSQLQNLTK